MLLIIMQCIAKMVGMDFMMVGTKSPLLFLPSPASGQEEKEVEILHFFLSLGKRMVREYLASFACHECFQTNVRGRRMLPWRMAECHSNSRIYSRIHSPSKWYTINQRLGYRRSPRRLPEYECSRAGEQSRTIREVFVSATCRGDAPGDLRLVTWLSYPFQAKRRLNATRIGTSPS